MTSPYDILLPLMKQAMDSGVSDVGAWDANQHDPENEDRKADAISRGFSVNKSVDDGSEMSEPGTIPHAWKVAAAKAWLRKQAAGIGGVASPVTPPKMPKPPSTSVKPLPALDGRTDKPEGMNLMQGVQTVSNGANIGASYSSFGRRLQGSPV